MGRMTRAKAAEVADNMHVDEDALLAVPDEALSKLTLDKADGASREALGEIAVNAAGHVHDFNPEMELRKSTRGRKGAKKGGAKGKRNNNTQLDEENQLGASTASAPEKAVDVVSDGSESCLSPTSNDNDDASVDSRNATLELDTTPHLTTHDNTSQTPPSNAARLTRSQLRKVPSGLENINPESFTLAQPATENTQAEPPALIPTLADDKQQVTDAAIDTESAHEEIMSTDAAPYDELEAAAVEAQATPPRPSESPRAKSVDPIDALDALDEAVENVSSELSNAQNTPAKSKSKKAAPKVRPTKASQFRISLAHGPKDTPRAPALGKPRQSSGLSNSTGTRVISTSSERSNGEGPEVVEKKEVVIPHSKPRPISMSFPTPPPPPKSTKAPTKSTFRLPGEEVAAKLKAAREARLEKEAEAAKKKTFKARPAPTMNKTPAVRQTSTSKARESLMGSKPPGAVDAHRRANSVATTKPSKPIISRPATSTKPMSNRLSVAPTGPVKVSKRPSTAMANLNRPRPLSVMRQGPATTARPPTARPASAAQGLLKGNGTAKGKEVFNRAAQAKSAADKEKREKEDAAKQARIAAAERGRLASREWAEKQRLKKLAAAASSAKSDDAKIGSAAPTTTGTSSPDIAEPLDSPPSDVSSVEGGAAAAVAAITVAEE